MVWIFLGLGIALLVVGVLLAVMPTLRADRAHAHPEGDEEAWAVLSQPVVANELIRLPKDEPVWGRVLGSKFLQGSIVGAGSSLVLAGVVLSYALVVPGGLSTAEAANPTPKAAEQAPAAPVTTAPTQPKTETPAAGTTTTPKPGGAVAFVISSGQLSQEIAYNLKAQGFIDNQGNFLARLTERGLETAIQIGEFQIPQGAPLDKVIDLITRQ
ncbi:MAG TPA: hypothetical protein VK191_16115 [Symbiobacteriaceae bacterium]|nr:hypothetical protein [Symbiobacteriaceae bacterium]